MKCLRRSAAIADEAAFRDGDWLVAIDCWRHAAQRPMVGRVANRIDQAADTTLIEDPASIRHVRTAHRRAYDELVLAYIREVALNRGAAAGAWLSSPRRGVRKITHAAPLLNVRSNLQERSTLAYGVKLVARIDPPHTWTQMSSASRRDAPELLKVRVDVRPAQYTRRNVSAYVKLQELFGLAETHVSVRTGAGCFATLANGRPVQMTRDCGISWIGLTRSAKRTPRTLPSTRGPTIPGMRRRPPDAQKSREWNRRISSLARIAEQREPPCRRRLQTIVIRHHHSVIRP